MYIYIYLFVLLLQLSSSLSLIYVLDQPLSAKLCYWGCMWYQGRACDVLKDFGLLQARTWGWSPNRRLNRYSCDTHVYIYTHVCIYIYRCINIYV